MLLEDERGTVNLIVPPPVYERRRAVVRAAPLLRARGRLERREGTTNVLVSEVAELSAPPNPATGRYVKSDSTYRPVGGKREQPVATQPVAPPHPRARRRRAARRRPRRPQLRPAEMIRARRRSPSGFSDRSRLRRPPRYRRSCASRSPCRSHTGRRLPPARCERGDRQKRRDHLDDLRRFPEDCQIGDRESPRARFARMSRMTAGSSSTVAPGTGTPAADRRRWLALYVLCAGVLMIVLDVTIVNVALPSIQDDLGFSQSNLAWVVNAYLIPFGGLLLLVGRLGDLVGQRRVFLAGLTVFIVASLVLRPRADPGDADRRPLRPGRRRRADLGGDPGDDRDDVPRAARAGESDRRLRLRRLRRRLDRPARRRRPDRGDQLALDLLHQHADRDRDRASARAAGRGRPGHRARQGRRHPRRRR